MGNVSIIVIMPFFVTRIRIRSARQKFPPIDLCIGIQTDDQMESAISILLLSPALVFGVRSFANIDMADTKYVMPGADAYRPTG